MKFLIDMGLPPEWRETFENNGFEAKHWSEIGSEDVLPASIGQVVLRALSQHQDLLKSGALVVIEPANFRIRILPI
jgi:predicted nuclease of predicted toxin-antitoxin system